MLGWRPFIALLVPLAVHAAACGGVRPEALSYRFRQGMLDNEPRLTAQPRSRKHRRRARRKKPRPVVASAAHGWRNDVARRTVRLVDRPFAGTVDEATRRLLGAALGRSLPDGAVRGERLVLHDRPRPGDLVFFHDTRDRNRNGKLDDRFTTVGVVTARNGPQVTFVFILDGRARTGRVHLALPHRRRLPRQQAIANTYLRPKRPDDPPAARHLAGELLAGFTTIEPS